MPEQPNKPQQKPVQFAGFKDTDGWIINGKLTPFKDLTNEVLLTALKKAEQKELHHHNRAGHYNELGEKLLEEIERRGLKPVHLNTEFTRNNLKKKP